MSREQILAATLHRPLMLLLDEIVEWEQERIVCKKTFQPDEWFFQGHYPDFPIVPGVILCEAAMQAGAVLLSQHEMGEGVPVAGPGRTGRRARGPRGGRRSAGPSGRRRPR